MSYSHDIESAASVGLPWELLKNQNILITGSTGLIGTSLVEVLMSRDKRDYHVYASCRNLLNAQKRFKKYLGDPLFHLLEYDVVNPLCTKIPFHFVIHLANNASPNFFVSSPVEVMKSAFLGVVNLIDYGITHGLKRFLYVSSGEVYGEGDGRVFTEDYSGYVDCLNPRSCYPSSKRAAETLCVSYCSEYKVDAIIARPCHTYGPLFSDTDNRVYAQFIRSILNDEDIILKSSGEQVRSWCYVVDCALALLYVLFKGQKGEAYNIADPFSTRSIKELAEEIATLWGKKVIYNCPSSIERAGFNPVTKSVFSVDKLLGLGWIPMTSFKDGIKNTVEYFADITTE